MSVEVKPEKVQNATLSLRRLTQQIRQQVPTEGETLEAFASLTSVLADLIQSGWAHFEAKLQAGLDAEKARAAGAIFSLAAATWSEVLQSLDEAAKSLGQADQPVEWLSELAKEAPRIEEIRAGARRVVDSINAAFNVPLDQAMLRQSEDDFAAQRVQKGDEVIGRLRSAKS